MSAARHEKFFNLLSVEMLIFSVNFDQFDPFSQMTQSDKSLLYRVVFFTGLPLKVLSVRLHSKSPRKSFKCQNFLRVWHLVIFWAEQ